MNIAKLWVSLSAPVLVAATAGSAGAEPAAKVAVEAPAAAEAPAWDATQFEIGLLGFGSQVAFDHTLHGVNGPPDPLKDAGLRLVGDGVMPGAEVRITALPRDRFGRGRIGFGIGMAGATGLAVQSGALSPGVSFTADSLWTARFEGFLGQQFEIGRVSDLRAPGRRGWLYPYVDLVAVGAITQASVDLHLAKLGMVGTSTWNAYAFTLAPRFGVAIPLTDRVALDVGGTKSVYGVERYSGYGGLTFVGP